MNYNNYITFEELLNYRISPSYLKLALNLYRQKKSRSWANKKDIHDKRKVLIDLDTIPEATRKKYGVPTGKEYQEQKAEAERIAREQKYEADRIEARAWEAEQERQKIERHEAQEREKTILASNELQALRNAYYNEYIQYIPLYKEYYAGNKKIDHYAKLSAHEHAFFLEMIEVTGGIYRGEWGKAEQGFNHYRLLTKELKFQRSIHNIQNFRWLLADLRKCLSVGKSIVDVIGWGKTGKRPEQHIYNDFHRFLILHYV
ncbi:hypothetical protein, partial [Flavobacterium psychrophilum]|uniref:hypothetical protein n=1 Tax=Flavobacterium psychrophilum TaxID=96345 RepID=UPI00106963E8